MLSLFRSRSRNRIFPGGLPSTPVSRSYTQPRAGRFPEEWKPVPGKSTRASNKSARGGASTRLNDELGGRARCRRTCPPPRRIAPFQRPRPPPSAPEMRRRRAEASLAEEDVVPAVGVVLSSFKAVAITRKIGCGADPRRQEERSSPQQQPSFGWQYGVLLSTDISPSRLFPNPRQIYEGHRPRLTCKSTVVRMPVPCNTRPV